MLPTATLTSGLALAILATLPMPAAHAQDAPQDAPQRVAAGAQIERRITGLGTHIYEVELAAGQILDAVVMQVSSDFLVRLRAPDGTVVEEIDSPNGARGPEPVWHLATASGIYRLEVTTANELQDGRYALTVTAVRTPSDEERAFANAETAALEGKPLDPRTAAAFERALPLGRRVRRAIPSGAADVYRISLGQATLFWFALEQLGVDLVVKVFDPAGKMLHEIDGPTGAQGIESIETILEAPGEYRIEVTPLEAGASGRYQMLVLDMRPATETDRKRFEARRLAGVSQQLRADGRYAEALAPLERSVQMQQEIYGPDSAYMIGGLNRLSILYGTLGLYAKEEEILLRQLAIVEKTLGPDHSESAGVLNNIGLHYWNRGDYVKAEPLLRRALEIREKRFGPDHSLVAESRINLGNLYLDRGELEKAEASYLRALDIWTRQAGPDGGSRSVALLNLGNLYADMGRLDDAEPIFKECLELDERRFGPNSMFVAFDCGSLGSIYLEKGDYAAAESFLGRSLAIREAILGTDTPGITNTLLYQGLLSWVRGDLAVARRVFDRVEAITDRNLAQNLAIGSERQKRDFLDRYASDGDRLVTFHLASAPGDAQVARLALTSVLRRKGRALDATAGSIAALRERSSDADKALLDKLADARTQLSRLALAGRRDRSLGEYLGAVRQLEERIEQTEDEVSKRSNAFRAQVAPVTSESVQAALPENSTLIEIVRFRLYDLKTFESGAGRYAAYVVGRTGDPRLIDLGGAAPIDAAVAALREALRDPRRDAAAPARILDELVMRPVRATLGADIRHLLVSPDGALNLVPFAALVDERGKYLVERYTISYLTSGRDLLRMGEHVESTQPALVVADPDFQATTAPTSAPADAARTRAVNLANPSFAPLPGTEEEARAVGRLLRGSVVLTRERATKAALVGARAPRLLHVATHGFFVPDAPADAKTTRIEDPLLRSGLALAGANRRESGRGDGVMTALEVSGLDLWGTQLVVLSACDTGVGDVRNGEGVYGLRRALVLAGSETQMLSLWDVDDLATRDLMRGYYTALLDGTGRAEALREVQLKMLASSRRKHPAFWAGFIVSGDWRPLTAPK